MQKQKIHWLVGKLVFVLFVGLLSTATVVFMPAFATSQETAHQVSTELREQIAEFEKKHSVEIVFQGHKFKGAVTGVDSDKVHLYLPLLLEEFNLYPAGVLNKAKVDKIVLCKNLAWNKQLRGAIPGFSSRIMYYDAERAINNKFYLRSIVHHEFFHQIDWVDDGKVCVDKQWALLNPKEFKYGNGGAAVQGDPTQGVTFDKLGFMNKYSTQGVEEDKAEIFAYLMTRQEIMDARVKKDSVVAAKVKMMKTLMRSFSAGLDDSFWKKATQVVRHPESPTDERPDGEIQSGGQASAAN